MPFLLFAKDFRMVSDIHPGLPESFCIQQGLTSAKISVEFHEVLGRANSTFTALTYLPQETLQQRWPLDSIAEVKARTPVIAPKTS